MNQEETYLTPHIFTRHKLPPPRPPHPEPTLVLRTRPEPPAAHLPQRTHAAKTRPRPIPNPQTLTHNQIENVLLISESGIYALLVYHYCPEYRALREWLTHQVIPTLRDSQHPSTSERLHLSLLSWPDMTLSLLHWNNQPWIRLQDVPHMVTEREQVNRTVVNSWWRKALQLI